MDPQKVGDGYVESTGKVKCGMADLSNPGKFAFTAISSEPLAALTLEIKQANGPTLVAVLNGTPNATKPS
jgi:hypothetical protein